MPSFRHAGLEYMFSAASPDRLACRSCHKTDKTVTGRFPGGIGTALRLKPGRT